MLRSIHSISIQGGSASKKEEGEQRAEISSEDSSSLYSEEEALQVFPVKTNSKKRSLEDKETSSTETKVAKRKKPRISKFAFKVVDS